MDEQRTRAEQFWLDLEQRVTAKTRAVLKGGERARQPVIRYLREIEEMTRAECDRRQTVQVIASGLRLLGDDSGTGKASGSPPRTATGAP